MRVAAIDCGTNSIRLLIADVDGANFREIVRDMEIVRLGQGVDKTGQFHPDAIARTLAAVDKFALAIAATAFALLALLWLLTRTGGSQRFSPGPRAHALRRGLAAAWTRYVPAGYVSARPGLLAAGIQAVEGFFTCGDLVSLATFDPDTTTAQAPFARGLVNYTAAEVRQIAGLKTEQIGEVLGTFPYEEVIHRDNLSVIRRGSTQPAAATATVPSPPDAPA